MMSRFYFVLGFTLLWSLGACKEYINQSHYTLQKGDLLELYYSTNSCCYNCIVNQNELKHLQLMEEKTVDSGPRDCAGCNYTAAYIFKCTSSGLDTVKLKNVVASESCETYEGEVEEFIVEVK